MLRTMLAACLLLPMALPCQGGERGKAIFLGTAQDVRPMMANGEKAQRPLACASCHGRDALGSTEGGISAPAIAWRILGQTADGRQPYTERQLMETLHSGRRSDGRQLDHVMPRYDLSGADTADLTAYLHRVEEEQMAGVSNEHVRFAIVYEQGQQRAAATVLVRAEAAYERLGRPRLHGRGLVFQTVAFDDKQQLKDTFAAVLDVTSSYAAADSLVVQGMPVVGPLRGVAGTEDPLLVRGLFASSFDQWRALGVAAPPDLPVVAARDVDADLMRRAFPNRTVITPNQWFESLGPSAIVAGGLDSIPHPQNTLQGSVIYTTLDGSTRAAKLWINRGATLVLADPRQSASTSERNDYDRLAGVVVEAVVRALAASGREVTRTSFMKAFDSIAFTRADWHAVDFSRHRLTATTNVKLLKLTP